MKKSIIAMLPLAAFLLGCGQRVEKPTTAVVPPQAAEFAKAYASAEVRHAGERIQAPLPALELLRMGQTDAATEVLEHALDAAIIKAAASMRSVPHAEQRSTEAALSAAKTYREKHPRPAAIKITDIDTLHAMREEKRQKAEAILHGIDNDKAANK